MGSSCEIFRNFRFEAAQTLPMAPEDHPLKKLTGHSFRVRIYVSGKIDEDSGRVLDFADIDTAFEPILSELHQTHLNDIAGLENPTSENIARWIWKRLEGNLPGLSGVLLRETISGALYRETK